MEVGGCRGSGVILKEHKVHVLDEQRGNTIGRAPGSDVFVSDPFVSSRHATVRTAGEGWEITDEGSTNGTRVNGRRVWSGSLEPGDLIGLGRQSLAILGCGLEVEAAPPPGIIGQSYAARMLYRTLSQSVPKDATILLLGETGVGKTQWAKVLHQLSGRKGPFVDRNCANFSPELLESELFGHERGSFTGAVGKQLGVVAAAEGGTLFLDEIGELSMAAQAKLLTFLDTKRFCPLGGQRERTANVRLIAATNRELDNPYRRSGFRDDLYSRVARPPVRIPSLRDRREDIPLLVAHQPRHPPEVAFPSRWVTTEVVEALMIRPWYFNVRGLLEYVDSIKRIPVDAEQDDVRFLVETVAQYVESATRKPSEPIGRPTLAIGSPATPASRRVDTDALNTSEGAAAVERRPREDGDGRASSRQVMVSAATASAGIGGRQGFPPSGGSYLSVRLAIRTVLELIERRRRVTQGGVRQVLGVSSRRAQGILSEMLKQGLIAREGRSRGSYYVLAKERR